MSAMRFADPLWLLALAALPMLLYRYVQETRRDRSSMRYSSLTLLSGIPPTLWTRLRHVLPTLRLVGLACLILAMARPQAGKEIVDLSAQGVDIMLTLDVSSSMREKDLGRASRLEVAKEVVAEFIAGRTSDRIGMVVFAAESYTQCPVTLDYDILLSFLKDIRIADESWDGTAIGMALITATNRLRDSDADSKVIVLLTDGVNTAGEIAPTTAAEAAGALGIRVYTIGVGPDVKVQARRRGGELSFDEKMLMDIAQRTDANYYHATSKEKLEQIYSEIGELERTEVTSEIHLDYSERFASFLWPGFALLLLEFILANTRFRRIP